MTEVLTYEALKAERDALADKCDRLEYNLGNAIVGEQEALQRVNALEVRLINALSSEQEAIQRAHAANQTIDALAVENAALKDAIPRLKNIDYSNDSMDDVSLAEDIGFNTAVTQINNMVIETPATDAALAAIQAQGVDKLITLKMEQLANMHPDTHAFGATAESLRSQINELQAFATELREAK